MRCIRCNRPIGKAAVTNPASKTTYYGPKCARMAGLTQSKARIKVQTTQPREADPAQIDWISA